MSSGSLKDLTKAVNSSIATPTLPLPDDLIQVIHAYLDKHDSHDESDQQKLQEELLSIYEKDVVDKPARYAAFLAILRQLKRAIQGSGRLLQWWDRLAGPVLDQLGEVKGLPTEAHHTLLNILVYDEDDEELEDAKASCAILTENLLSSWLVKFVTASAGQLDPEALFVERKIKHILLEFGRKRPKDFLTSLDKFVVKKDSRIPALSLLVDFIEFQPPHLHQMLETPLFENLLRCLQVDTSTRAISLAMTATIMFLPHVPSSLASHLPALFNIYSRMLFWDRYRRSGPDIAASDEEKREEDKPSQMELPSGANGTVQWEKVSYLLDSEDDSVPELLHYFTFLYGLYPINFMSYIRKPQRYLRHAGFPGADELDVQPSEIRQRSETFRQLHLLHPNFFMLTLESELSDTNRWMKSQSGDVVAECMALYVPGDSSGPGPESRSRRLDPLSRARANEDVPEHPLLENEHPNSFVSRHNSWRHTTSAPVASPNMRGFAGMHRRASQTSMSMPSITDSPSLRPVRPHRGEEFTDSPTLPPTRTTPSPSNANVHIMLDNQKSLRGSLHQSLANESVLSLQSSQTHNDNSHQIESSFYNHAESVKDSDRGVSDTQIVIAYLHRELTLLRNDISFERYLKQQHLSHIGQLRRKQIREARVEAETQYLINSNRALKNKLEDVKQSNLQMKREAEKSRTHSRKWEADLSAKLRVLKEEKKVWTTEGDQLRRDLAAARDELYNMKQLIVNSESREFGSQQKLQSIESNLHELNGLRAEVERLTISLRGYQAKEGELESVNKREENALKEVEILRMKLTAREAELEKSKKDFDDEIAALQTKGEDSLQNIQGKPPKDIQAVLDDGLAATRSRVVELQKAHHHLLKRYTALESAYLDLKSSERYDEPLLSGGITRAYKDRRMHSRNSSPTEYHRKARQHTMSDPDPCDDTPIASSYFPVRPARLNTDFASFSSDSRSATDSSSSHFQTFSPKSAKNVNFASGGELGEDGKPKIKPGSDVRVYGRGGVQNIGKQAKEKKDKKNSGMKGIRSFV